MDVASRRLGEFLVERKVLSREDLEQALVAEQRDGVPLAKILMAGGLVGERDLVAAVGHQMGVSFHDFARDPVNPMVDRLVPAELARRHAAVAVDVQGSDLLVAMEDPTNAEAAQQISVATGWPVKPVLAVRNDIRRVLLSMYGPQEGSVGPGHSDAVDIDLASEPTALSP